MTIRRSDAAIGKRDRLVRLVPITDSTGTSGFPVESDAAPEVELWASKDDLGGRERIVMNQESAPFDTRWILPFGSTFDPDTVDVPKTYALEHRGRRYDIIAAAVIGRAEAVELLTLSRKG